MDKSFSHREQKKVENAHTLELLACCCTFCTVNRESFVLKNFRAIIFRTRAGRTKIFQQRKFFNNENLEHKVAQRTCTLEENGSRRQIEWNHVFSVTTACWRGVAMRQYRDPYNAADRY